MRPEDIEAALACMDGLRQDWPKVLDQKGTS
jgi:hypothetical protein